jgi:phage virion morphogenesis protein
MIDGLARLDEDALLTTIGATGEMQTRRRIEEEKTAPDGSAWPANRAGTSILLQSGSNLRDSIAHDVGGGATEWGASWEYAHVHQDGAVIKPRDAKRLSFMIGGERVFARQVTIPARSFVGLSEANKSEIVDVVTDFLGVLGGGR